MPAPGGSSSARGYVLTAMAVLAYYAYDIGPEGRAKVAAELLRWVRGAAGDPAGAVGRYFEALQKSGGLNMILAAFGCKLIAWNIRRKGERKRKAEAEAAGAAAAAEPAAPAAAKRAGGAKQRRK